MNETIEYIKTLLTYGDAEAARCIGYTLDQDQWSAYKVVILPSGHMNGELVYPSLKRVTPTLHDKTYIIEEDLIYNTFFFISRAEELLITERDKHGRFTAANSLLGRKNRLAMPLVDEYSRLVSKLLEVSLPDAQFSAVNLTHDIDTIANYRHLRGALGGIYRGDGQHVLDSWHNIHDDPAYTFPWLMSMDARCTARNKRVIYFVKHTRGCGYDYPQYNLRGHDWRQLHNRLRAFGAVFGLHSSYYADYSRLNIAFSTRHRSHYLRCSIDDMQRLADMGITDDYSMGFADSIGFRLQTCRPVRWINPNTRQLTPLTLHPLTIMDVTLSNPEYMNLTKDEAYFACTKLLEKVRQHGGEVNLLWHNNNIRHDTYHRSLYPKILATL